ncbi:sortase [Microbacter sp. GSS18]|nr:sortase [Microbacter sp. GSS18]
MATARTIIRALAAGLVVLALSACSGPPSEDAARTAAPTVEAAVSAPRPTPVVDVPVTAATPAPARVSVPPVRLTIEAIGVDMPVEPVGVEPGGFMELPADPAVAGWYRFGSDPQSDDGNIVVSAHVDAPDRPIGPLSRLRDLSGGETITVADAEGVSHTYRVESVTYYPKQDLPVDGLFAREGSDSLVVITCGGDFDRTTGRYADNVVAVATPVA